MKCIDEEIPFEIPQGWEWCRMGSIGEWGAGATPAKGNLDYYNGNILWLRTGELNNDVVYDTEIKITEKALRECSLRLCKPGDVLIAMYGATIGKVAIAGKEMTTNQACCACTPIGVFNWFLFYFLMGSQLDFIKKGEGGAQPNISREKLIKHLMPVPPIEEQQRIVLTIREVLPYVDKYAHSQDALNHLNQSIRPLLRKSILQEAIQGKLVSQDPNDEPASILLQRIREEKLRLVREGKLKKKDVVGSIIYKGDDNKYYENVNGHIKCIEEEIPFDIPESWKWVRLSNISIVARGGSPRPIKDYITESSNGINWIKIGDTEKGGKYINRCAEKIKPEGVSKSRLVKPGDFLLTNSMSFGRPYITNVEGCIHDGWLVISQYVNVYDTDFLFYLLSSPFAYGQFSGKTAGAVVQNLNKDKVAESIFPLPPLQEQKRIIAKMIKLMNRL